MSDSVKDLRVSKKLLRESEKLGISVFTLAQIRAYSSPAVVKVREQMRRSERRLPRRFVR